MAYSGGSIKVEVDMRKMEKLMNGAGPKAEALLDDAAFRIKATAKEKAPVDTGNLRSSIRVNPRHRPFQRRVEANAEYAAAVEFGSEAHDIRPKNKKALFWKGASHPVKVVHHPGAGAHPYMVPALEAERPRFLLCWDELLK